VRRSSARTSATHARPYAQARASDGRPRGRSDARQRGGKADTAQRGTGTRRLVGLAAAAAAAYADVSTRTLRRYIAQGRLTGYRVGPRLLKVDLDDLDRLARPIPTARGPG
jgi:excisionase family DNA binding protein